MRTKLLENTKKYGKWLLIFMLPWPILIGVAAYKSYIVYKQKSIKQNEKSDKNQT